MQETSDSTRHHSVNSYTQCLWPGVYDFTRAEGRQAEKAS